MEMVRPAKIIFTWRKEWVSSFESPWSVFQKFKLANELTTNEMLRALGTEKVRSLRTGFRNNHYELIELQAFDSNLLRSALSYDLVACNSKSLDQLVGILPYNHLANVSGNRLFVYFRDKLFFCIECMKSGFHSLFHQFKLLHKCPYHQAPLISNCPNCGIEYDYSLSEKMMPSPYECKCRHCYLSFEDIRFYREWESTNMHREIKNKQLQDWLQLTILQKEKLKHLYFYPNIDFERYPDTLNFFLNAIFESQEKNNNHFYVFTSPFIQKNLGNEEKLDLQKFSKKGEYLHINEYFIKGMRLKVLHRDINISLKRTIAGLAKYIRNRIIPTHRSCLNRLKKFNPEDPVCPYAYAYLVWRKYLQNYIEFNRVDRFDRPVRLEKNDIEIPRFFDFVRDLFDLWSESLNDLTVSSRAANKWILNRLVAFVAMNHFRNWILQAEQLSNEKVIPGSPIFGHDNLPFFLIAFSGPFKEKMEFHSWTYPAEIPRLNCPFHE